MGGGGIYDKTRDDLAHLLRVEPETGFVFKISTGKRTGFVKKGTPSSGGGYRIVDVRFDGRNHKIQEHRLIWLFAHWSWPEGGLDHINGDRADNRLANLRPATGTQNKYNRPSLKNNTSGFKWVYRTDRGWRAEVGYRDEYGAYRKRTARCRTPEEAFEKACRFAKEVHGEFYNPGKQAEGI